MALIRGRSSVLRFFGSEPCAGFDQQLEAGPPDQFSIDLMVPEGMLEQHGCVKYNSVVFGKINLLYKQIQNVFKTANQKIVFAPVMSIKGGMPDICALNDVADSDQIVQRGFNEIEQSVT